jgi:hypothetical protein
MNERKRKTYSTVRRRLYVLAMVVGQAGGRGTGGQFGQSEKSNGQFSSGRREEEEEQHSRATRKH